MKNIQDIPKSVYANNHKEKHTYTQQTNKSSQIRRKNGAIRNKRGFSNLKNILDQKQTGQKVKVLTQTC